MQPQLVVMPQGLCQHPRPGAMQRCWNWLTRPGVVGDIVLLADVRPAAEGRLVAGQHDLRGHACMLAPASSNTPSLPDSWESQS